MMILSQLTNRINLKEAKLAIIGLGYVGLPVACLFAEANFDVLGVDIRDDIVENINLGISPITGIEPGLDSLLKKVINHNNQQEEIGGLYASTDYFLLEDRDIVIIAVETPVDQKNHPQYHGLKSAITKLGTVMKEGTLVIVESTISPGTMNSLVLPLLEKSSNSSINQGFYLGHCPERVMPGKLLANLRNVSRVVGGMTPETAETMVALYRHIVQADLDPVDCVTAELVKTTENAYRDVQIAFANEVALICEAVGGDVWKVRELVNKSPYRQMHLPGAGVGGHCIPKDPWLLAYGVNDKDVPLHLIPAARAVNDSMPLHVVDLLQEALESNNKRIENAKILIMGYAYLEDSDDTRNSPSKILVEKLHQLQAKVIIHDPYVPEFQGDLIQLAEACDAAILMVRHQEYKNTDLKKLASKFQIPILIDTRQMYTLSQAEAAGFIYRGLGVGLL
jgi:UDP-N-acetyl-D-mannosaminuronic acid dehydrogenase